MIETALQTQIFDGLFSVLDETVKDLFLHRAKVTEFDLGDEIFKEGSSPDTCYFLLDGRVRLIVGGAKEKTIGCLLEPGQLIGADCLKNAPSRVTARASTPCTVMAVPCSLLKEIAEQYPAIAKELSKWETQYEELFASKAEAEVPEESAADVPTSNIRLLVQKTGNTEETVEAFGTILRRRFHKYPLILQQSAMDCGVACLAMVIKFYGRTANMSYLRSEAGVSAQGSDLLSLSETAEKVGLLAKGIKATYEGLLRLRMPLICHWDSNHYVVLYEASATHALIADPANDLVEIPREKFTEHFTGYALELTPTQTSAPSAKQRLSFQRFLPLLLPYKRVLIDIAAASVLVQILSLAMPLFTQVVIDKVLVHQSLSMLNMILLGMVVLTVFETIVSLLRTYFIAFTGMKLDQAMFVQFYKHMLSLPLSFFEERTTGDILSRMGENRKVQHFLSSSAITSGIDLIMAAVYFAIIIAYNATFALVVFANLVLFAALAIVTAPLLRDIRRKAFAKEVATNSFVIESVRGIERVKSAATEQRTRWTWEELFADSLNTNYRGTLTARFAQIGAELIHLVGSVFLLWLGAQLVVAEQLSIGQLMALTLMVSRVIGPIMYFIDLMDEMQDLGVAFERLSDVLDAPPEEPNPDEKVSIKIKGDIRFEQVTFRYPTGSGTNAVQNFTFHAKPGQTVAIVGRSGCGKSTLLKLIQGFYSPTEGHIYVDGQDMQHMSLPSMRKQIGVVAQQEYLFRGTIRDTIAYYKPDATDDEVLYAAQMAGIHDFIKTLPKAYHYQITEGGSNLSGGQRQRLAIARAILHEPAILLFDEATSFLDAESEHLIQQNVEKLRKGRTTFLVAHRLSTIINADVILVMDRGQIVEQGAHTELLQKQGLYYHLYSQQSSP